MSNRQSSSSSQHDRIGKFNGRDFVVSFFTGSGAARERFDVIGADTDIRSVLSYRLIGKADYIKA
eukprot:scaffold2659_cov107-Cylindrotheca_fusiformis.AAC.12